MMQQERVEYTPKFLKAEFRFDIDRKKWERDGWIVVKVEKYPDSWFFSPQRIVVVYQREIHTIEPSEE